MPTKPTQEPSLTPVKSQLATREMGYASQTGATSTWWGGVGQDREHSPELRWPHSVDVFDMMRRSDPQVASVLRAVTHPVRRTPWRIDPNGARPEVVQHVAQDLGLPVLGSQEPVGSRTRDRFSWQRHLQLALLMLPFGHMVFEQTYRIEDATGLARLRKLGPRFPHTISSWNVARDGGLISVEQGGDPRPGMSSGKSILPVSRVVVYVNEREEGWWGQSLLRPAYQPWAIKARMMVTLGQSIERNGMGVPIYTGAPDASSDDLAAGADLAMQMRAGDNSGAAIPNGASLTLAGVQGQTADVLGAIRYLDDSIARAVLAQVLQLGSKTGSYALSSTFADIFTQSLQAIAQNIADTANAHIIEDLVDVNYGPDEPAPKLVFDEIGGKAVAVAEAVKTLLDAGAITADQGLEAFMRTSLGLPAESGEPNDAQGDADQEQPPTTPQEAQA